MGIRGEMMEGEGIVGWVIERATCFVLSSEVWRI